MRVNLILTILLLLVPVLVSGQDFQFDVYNIELEKAPFDAKIIKGVNLVLDFKSGDHFELIYDIFNSTHSTDIYFTTLIGGNQIVAKIVKIGESEFLLFQKNLKPYRYNILKYKYLYSEFK